MSVPEQFWRKWNWGERAPFLGEITTNPDRRYLLAGRKALLDDAERDLSRQVQMGDAGITLVCGSPGVGKSTFLDCLLSERFEGRGKRVSLIFGVQNPMTGFSEIEPSQFLDFFSIVEQFLIEILQQRQIQSDQTAVQRRRGAISLEPGADPTAVERHYLDMVRAIIYPLCEKVQEGNFPQHYLGVDDVDYLHPRQQSLFISMLCGMAAKSGNPKILYSARPVAAKIAKQSATSMYSHYTSEPIRVEAVRASRVIDYRCTDADQYPDAINPIGAEGVREIVDSYCSGNLREALHYVKIAQQYPHRVLRSSDHVYDKPALLNLLSGAFRRNAQADDDDTDIDSDIVDIFSGFSGEDRYPPHYALLRAVDSLESCYVSDELYDEFRRYVRECNPNLQQLNVPKQFIDELVNSFHRLHLIRRTSIKDISEYIKRDFDKLGQGMYQTQIRLTTRGKRLLILSRDPDYQRVTNFIHLAAGTQRYVNQASLKLAGANDGDFIVAEG